MPLEDPEGETETHNSIITSNKSLELSLVCFNSIHIIVITWCLCIVFVFAILLGDIYLWCRLLLIIFVHRNVSYFVLHYTYDFLLVSLELLSVSILAWWMFTMYLIFNRIFIETIVMNLSYCHLIKCWPKSTLKITILQIILESIILQKIFSFLGSIFINLLHPPFS